MQITVTLDKSSLDRLQTLPGMLQQALRGAAMGIAARSAADLRDSTDTPRWTNNLADSMRAIPTADGAMMLVEAKYARWVHDGLPPGTFPNVDNIADWAKAHGKAGAEWAIAAKIKRDGIKARPFLKNYSNSMGFEAMVKQVIAGEVEHALA